MQSGTTWIEQVILLLLSGGDISRLNPASKNAFAAASYPQGKIWPEACVDQSPQVHLKAGDEFLPISLAEFDAAPSPRIIKTHAHVDLLLGCNENGVSGLPEGVKIIVMNRNPLDTCVSCFHHAFNPAKKGWPFEAYASAWAQGKVPHGSWFEFTKAWWAESKTHTDQVPAACDVMYIWFK